MTAHATDAATNTPAATDTDSDTSTNTHTDTNTDSSTSTKTRAETSSPVATEPHAQTHATSAETQATHAASDAPGRGAQGLAAAAPREPGDSEGGPTPAPDRPVTNPAVGDDHHAANPAADPGVHVTSPAAGLAVVDRDPVPRLAESDSPRGQATRATPSEALHTVSGRITHVAASQDARTVSDLTAHTAPGDAADSAPGGAAGTAPGRPGRPGPGADDGHATSSGADGRTTPGADDDTRPASADAARAADGHAQATHGLARETRAAPRESGQATAQVRPRAPDPAPSLARPDRQMEAAAPGAPRADAPTATTAQAMDSRNVQTAADAARVADQPEARSAGADAPLASSPAGHTAADAAAVAGRPEGKAAAEAAQVAGPPDGQLAAEPCAADGTPRTAEAAASAAGADAETGAAAAPAPPAGAAKPSAPTQEPASSASALEPLVDPLFRALWAASVVSNVGTWMQNVGGAWLMTELTPSPVLVALMQTATSLPIFMAGLPAGALADLVDRRRLLLVAQTWMLLVAAGLGALTLLGLMNPWLLLAFTFALGLGNAFNAPAWQSITPEIVPGRHMPQAVALESAGFNLARAVGPALGGLIVAWIGPGANFMLNAASFLATIVVLYRWRRTRRHSHLPGERLLSATRTGLRYARHAPELHAVLVRTTAFVLCASALWALLPQVARRELGLASSGYGVLLASLGLGAVAGAGLLPRLRDRFSADARVGGASAIFGLATLALGSIPNLPLLCAIMAVAGVAWMIITSGLNVMVQACVPKWVKARALGTYLLVFQGTLAVSSLAWGLVAEHLGDSMTLAIAAAGLVLGVAATWRWRLDATEQVDVRPMHLLPEPSIEDAPDPEEGPVLVTAEYHIDLAKSDAFVLAMRELGRVRRRDGAMRWGLFRDPSVPGRYIESFVVESWAEHLRQVERATLADRALDERARSYLVDDDHPVVTHLVAAQAPDAAGPVTSGV